MADTAKEIRQVYGQLAKLAGGRLVFVGSSSEQPGVVYIAFRNAQGDDLNLSLSPEAFETMVSLHAKGAGTEQFPHKTEWRVVR